jgi:hypothetical protein
MLKGRARLDCRLDETRHGLANSPAQVWCQMEDPVHDLARASWQDPLPDPSSPLVEQHAKVMDKSRIEKCLLRKGTERLLRSVARNTKP